MNKSDCCVECAKCEKLLKTNCNLRSVPHRALCVIFAALFLPNTDSAYSCHMCFISEVLAAATTFELYCIVRDRVSLDIRANLHCDVYCC